MWTCHRSFAITFVGCMFKDTIGSCPRSGQAGTTNNTRVLFVVLTPVHIYCADAFNFASYSEPSDVGLFLNKNSAK